MWRVAIPTAESIDAKIKENDEKDLDLTETIRRRIATKLEQPQRTMNFFFERQLFADYPQQLRIVDAIMNELTMKGFQCSIEEEDDDYDDPSIFVGCTLKIIVPTEN